MNGGLSDTWLWDGTAWTNAADGGAPNNAGTRSRHGAAFDEARGVVVIHDGYKGNLTFENTTATWNGTTWSDAGAGIVDNRSFHGSAYDPARMLVLSYGGREIGVGGTTSAGLHAWNGTTWTTVQDGTPNPGPRAHYGLAFDRKRGVLVLFGGYRTNSSDATDETWLWDGTSWTLAEPAQRPSARYSLSMTYDEQRERVIMVGGYGTNPSAKTDTWEWNGSTWIPSVPYPGTAPPQNGYVLAYDVDRKVSVLVDTTLGHTYEYAVVGNACTTGADCASGFCVDRVCCSSPSCGTCQSCNQLGSPGTCAPVRDAPDPDTCAAPMRCNASAMCQ